jgi:hypothetical protein
MRVFVGFGYNERDQWIEKQVFPILSSMGFTVVHGKAMQGKELPPEIKSRIEQSDAAIGFLTIREGQEQAEFNSHVWVLSEMVYADAKGKPIIPVKEDSVHDPRGLLGNRQFITLRQNDRLACVVELVETLGRRNIRRLKLEPEDDQLRRTLHQWRKNAGFVIRYRTQDEQGVESEYRKGRLELVDQGFYLNVSDVPKRAHVEVEGILNETTEFSSGWAAADAVHVKIF